MDNALIQVAVVRRSRRTVAETWLLNASRITDFFQNSSQRTVFYFNDRSDRNEGIVEMETEMGANAFKTLVRETAARGDVTINVTGMNPTGEGFYAPAKNNPYSAPAARVTINLEYFIRAIDYTDGTGSYVWVAKGANKKLVYFSSNTIDEIDGTASAAASTTI